MSIEDYDAHWLGEHSKIFSTMQVVKDNLLRYEQVRPAMSIATEMLLT